MRVYDTKAVLQKELEENKAEFDRDGWELHPSSNFTDSVVYFRKPFVENENDGSH